MRYSIALIQIIPRNCQFVNAHFAGGQHRAADGKKSVDRMKKEQFFIYSKYNLLANFFAFCVCRNRTAWFFVSSLSFPSSLPQAWPLHSSSHSLSFLFSSPSPSSSFASLLILILILVLLTSFHVSLRSTLHVHRHRSSHRVRSSCVRIQIRASFLSHQHARTPCATPSTLRRVHYLLSSTPIKANASSSIRRPAQVGRERRCRVDRVTRPTSGRTNKKKKMEAIFEWRRRLRMPFTTIIEPRRYRLRENAIEIIVSWP